MSQATLPATDRLRTVLQEHSTQIKVLTSRIELVSSILDQMKTQLEDMHSSREDTSNLKLNHKSFTEAFNTNIKAVESNIDTIKTTHVLEMKSLSSKIDSLRSEIVKDYTNKYTDLGEKIDVLNKTLMDI